MRRMDCNLALKSCEFVLSFYELLAKMVVSYYFETRADRENLRGPGKIFPRPGRRMTLLFLSYNQFQKSWDRCHKTFEFQQTTISPAPCSMLCPISRRV